jgi:hypothetical protein
MQAVVIYELYTTRRPFYPYFGKGSYQERLLNAILIGKRFRGPFAQRHPGHQIPDIVLRVLEAEDRIDIFKLVDELREEEEEFKPCFSLFC